MTLAESLVGTGCRVPVAAETQGEAVAFSIDGLRYVTVSEGAAQQLHTSTCGP